MVRLVLMVVRGVVRGGGDEGGENSGVEPDAVFDDFSSPQAGSPPSTCTSAA